MARPQKQGLDYFPHDTDAMNDEKLEVMQLLYGNDGYAFYFKMLERIYRTPNLMLDISDAETHVVMIRKCNVDEERFGKMLSTALKQGLFDKVIYEETGCITSNGVHKRSEVVMQKREKMRERHLSRVSAAETREETRQETREETTPETRQSKVKKSKGKESKEEERKIEESKEEKHQYAERVTLTPTEHALLVNRFGLETTNRCIEELSNYKLANGKEYASDAGAIMSWVHKRVEEQDARQAPRYQVHSKPLSSGNKNIKPGMEIHIQDDDAVSDEEFQRILADALKLDQERAKREADRKRMEDNSNDE